MLTRYLYFHFSAFTRKERGKEKTQPLIEDNDKEWKWIDEKHNIDGSFKDSIINGVGIRDSKIASTMLPLDGKSLGAENITSLQSDESTEGQHGNSLF